MSGEARGRAREVKVVDLFILRGWQAFRCASGPVDVIALDNNARLEDDVPPLEHPAQEHGPIFVSSGRQFVQVKSTAGGPYEKFRRAERAVFLACARAAGADPWLAWWPPHARSATWIPGSAWPSTQDRKRVATG